ncbi:MAG TPA: hypothetical protein VFK59_10835 [Actinomycetota bacterium]|nr:hypothetical protein [Actinomycetota bacterium]
MPDLRERFRALDDLEVPDVMTQARLIGPRPPQLEPPPTTRRIGALVLVAAIAIVAVVLGARALRQPVSVPATTGPDVAPDRERVGFIGLPPEGATPSTPSTGELVVSLYGRSTTDGGLRFRAWVYADGRIVWDKEGDYPYGANGSTTGYLEQRLTAEGVELLRSEIVETGLFDRDRALRSEGVIWGLAQVRLGDRLVEVDWDQDPRGETRLHFTDATPEQAIALERLDALLTHPASWLPRSAWEDQQIRAYVPSRFAVCYSAAHGGIGSSAVLRVLPDGAANLLRATADGSDASCSDVAIEEARTLVEILDDAGLERDERSAHIRLGYSFEPSVPLAPGPIENTVDIFFEPYLPHGEFVECSPCG